MKELNPNKTALTLGILISGLHLFWSVLIILGWAQSLVNFVFWAHMLSTPYQVTGFTLTQSVTLVIVTFGVGYGIGLLFATIWNKMHKV